MSAWRGLYCIAALPMVYGMKVPEIKKQAERMIGRLCKSFKKG